MKITPYITQTGIVVIGMLISIVTAYYITQSKQEQRTKKQYRIETLMGDSITTCTAIRYYTGYIECDNGVEVHGSFVIKPIYKP